MTENQDQHEELQEDATENIEVSEPQDTVDDVDVVEGREEDAVDEVANLMEEKAALQDKLVRTAAELENVRRRAAREREDALKYGVANAAKGFLGVADTFDRAMAAWEQAHPNLEADVSPAVQSFVDGISSTQSELLKALEKMGITPVPAEIGTRFDPHQHDVMFEADHPDYGGGAIIQVVENGYMAHDRLLRPAKVGVAKKPADGRMAPTAGGDAEPEKNSTVDMNA